MRCKTCGVVLISKHNTMGLYKLSSQFTTFIKARSQNPEKILEEVSDAIEHQGEMGVPLPGGSSVLEAFHASDDVDDEFILSHLGEMEAAPIVNQMYDALGKLTTSGKLSLPTRKWIEKFLTSGFKRLEEPKKDRTVIRRQKPVEEALVEPIKVEPFQVGNRWERNEDRMLDRLDRERTASVVELFTKAGILECIPTFEERKVRLAERSFEWTKFASEEPEFDKDDLDEMIEKVKGQIKEVEAMTSFGDSIRMQATARLLASLRQDLANMLLVKEELDEIKSKPAIDPEMETSLEDFEF